MNRVSAAVVALVLGTVTSAANAAYITGSDITFGDTGGIVPGGVVDGYGGASAKKLEGGGDWIAWTHQFSFAPAAAKINSGTLEVTLKDDKNDLFDPIEIAFGFAESGQWAFGLVSSATYSYDLAVHTLLDGSFSVKLISLLGDFYITKSVLKVDYTPVPEPATLSLMGIGLLGAAFGCRRRAKKSKAI